MGLQFVFPLLDFQRFVLLVVLTDYCRKSEMNSSPAPTSPTNGIGSGCIPPGGRLCSTSADCGNSGDCVVQCDGNLYCG